MTGQRTDVMVQLLMELVRRIGTDGPRCIPSWVDAGYCLDAPELVPAGSTVRDQYGDAEDEVLDMPSFVQREVVNA